MIENIKRNTREPRENASGTYQHYNSTSDLYVIQTMTGRIGVSTVSNGTISPGNRVIYSKNGGDYIGDWMPR